MAAPFKFFDNQPQKGRPIALKGVAAGLAKLARAVERIEIFGGRVDWHNGEPLLIPPEFNGYSSGASEPMPFDIRVNTADNHLEIYVPYGTGGTVTGMVKLNNEDVATHAGALTAVESSNWWYLNYALPGTGVTHYVTAFLVRRSGVTGDLTAGGSVNLDIRVYTEPTSGDLWQGYRAFAIVANVGGAITVYQQYHGILSMNRFTDAESVAVMGASKAPIGTG
jgi:hypothetical protein